ncbi:histone methyltransferase [Chloropicon primus]|uniref:Histone methyltransferase n=2 Tax=Chloropicon primus TaxID=1764295 RepID=A0A5B8MN15_9CHLO|nr:histone methyltransferase [Chloropicon primus]|eukprot:QDZ21787.1 histone methyltransferase [Chloropicon primus]
MLPSRSAVALKIQNASRKHSKAKQTSAEVVITDSEKGSGWLPSEHGESGGGDAGAGGVELTSPFPSRNAGCFQNTSPQLSGAAISVISLSSASEGQAPVVEPPVVEPPVVEPPVVEPPVVEPTVVEPPVVQKQGRQGKRCKGLLNAMVKTLKTTGKKEMENESRETPPPSVVGGVKNVVDDFIKVRDDSSGQTNGDGPDLGSVYDTWDSDTEYDFFRAKKFKTGTKGLLERTKSLVTAEGVSKHRPSRKIKPEERREQRLRLRFNGFADRMKRDASSTVTVSEGHSHPASPERRDHSPSTSKRSDAKDGLHEGHRGIKVEHEDDLGYSGGPHEKSDTLMSGPSCSKLNRGRLKAELHRWYKEYKEKEMVVARKENCESILEHNRTGVMAQIARKKKLLRSRLGDHLHKAANPVTENAAVEELSKKSFDCCIRTKFKVDESLEIPKSTSWVLTKKNILGERVEEFEFMPHLGDDSQPLSGYIDQHDSLSYLPDLEERQCIKYLVLKAIEEHGRSQHVIDVLHDWVEDNIIAYYAMKESVIPGMIPHERPKESGPAYSFDTYPRLRSIYCKRCHIFNCLIHKGLDAQESCIYDRETILGNEFLIEKGLPTKRMLAPVKPLSPCSGDCCLHTWEDSAEGETGRQQEGTSANTNQSSDMPADAPSNWKEQCVLLGSIYESDCCKVSKILQLPCKAIRNYLTHKCKQEEKLHVESPSVKVVKPKKKAGRKRKNYKKQQVMQILEQDVNDYCKYKYEGCNCKAQQGHCKTNACPCFARGSECDPDTCNCTGCRKCDTGPTGCFNRKMQTWSHVKTLVGKSDVQGWGLFVKDGVKKNQFICEYTGERIPTKEADRRGALYDDKAVGTTFLFDLASGLDSHPTVDALRLGAKSKFINHPPTNRGVQANCTPKNFIVRGDKRLGIFALRDIAPMEELFFDYNFNNDGKIEWFQELKLESSSRRAGKKRKGGRPRASSKRSKL